MYEIVKWKDGNNEIEFRNEHSFVGVNNLLISNNNINTLDVVDVNFNSKVKRADKIDYSFAILSGIISSIVDTLLIGKIDLEKIEKMDYKDILSLLKIILAMYHYSDKEIQSFEKKFNDSLHQVEETIRSTNNYVNMVKDFASSLSVKGLLISILSKICGYKFGADEKGKIIFEKIDDKKLDNFGIFKKIELGVIDWFLIQTESYRQTGTFENEMDDFLIFKKEFDNIKLYIKELSKSGIFKDKETTREVIYLWFEENIEETNEEDINLEIKDLLNKQKIPVIINKCFIRAYYFIKLFIETIKEKKVVSIQGLEHIDLMSMTNSKKRIIARMDTVSTGVFACLDGLVAAVFAIKESAKEKGKKEKLAKGLYEFCSRINYVNSFELILVCKIDSKYIFEDVVDVFNRLKDIKHINIDTIKNQTQVNEILNDYMGLDRVSTSILYSLKLQMILEDIQHTKDSNTQISKDNWRKEWVKKSIESVEHNKLFELDKEKLYSKLITYASNGGNKDWLYRILLELSTFKPYYQLDDNKQKKLNLSKFDYIKEEFLKKQNVISEIEYNSIVKLYKKYYSSLGDTKGKAISGVMATLVIGAITAGTAYVFAPAIAVGLVGGSFATLHGAALTSASLALFGGGAISAGGLGMAGGALVIAGGGALVGIGSTGITATALTLLSSPKYMQNDMAKLLANCDYVLLKKYNKKEEIKQIEDKINSVIGDLELRIISMKNNLNLDKDNKKENQGLVKGFEGTVKILKKTSMQLRKML